MKIEPLYLGNNRCSFTKKMIDTSAEEWVGSGTSAADHLIGKEQNITLKRESFILYESE
jgi:hypothetical protein